MGSIKVYPSKFKRIQEELSRFSEVSWRDLPVEDINRMLRKQGLVLIDGDRTRWQKSLDGEKGSTKLGIGINDPDFLGFKQIYPDTGHVIELQWKKTIAGLYEIKASQSCNQSLELR